MSGHLADRRVLGRSPSFALAALLGLGLAACNQPPEESAPERAQASNKITAKADVVSVDAKTRLVGLRSTEGKSWTVLCGPEVRNFDQIKVGDKVAVNYVESLEVAIAAPGAAGKPATVSVAAGRAAEGATPGAAIGAQVTATVRVESVDKERNIVVITPPSGGMRVVHVQRPEGKKFIQGLKPGDQVEITYTEAVAISVEKQ